MNTITTIIIAAVVIVSAASCALQRQPENVDESTKVVPVVISKAGGDVISQQRIVNVSDGADALPATLWSVGGVGSIVAGYVVWLVRHHLRQRRQVRCSSSNSHTPVA